MCGGMSLVECNGSFVMLSLTVFCLSVKWTPCWRNSHQTGKKLEPRNTCSTFVLIVYYILYIKSAFVLCIYTVALTIKI